MATKMQLPVGDQDVFAVSDKGSAELKGAGTSLSTAELKVLVLVDGRSSVAQVVRSARGLLRGAVHEALGGLLGAGLILPAKDATSNAIDVGDFFSVKVPPRSAGAAQADPELAEGISTLKQQGYYVRIARRPIAKRTLAAGEKFTVLVVEDDPDLTKLLRMYLQLEGFAPRLAGGREEITAAFRQPPRPDLVMLDVALPDVDGFDVLAKMRQHPALIAVPVIMLTGKDTREAVLNGLVLGADGYVTKPFEIDVLMKAVKSVLGV